jgi:hypothetical protein
MPCRQHKHQEAEAHNNCLPGPLQINCNHVTLGNPCGDK